jgi:hypothetical protein
MEADIRVDWHIDEDESFLSKVLEYFVPSSHDHGRKYAEGNDSET